MLDHRTVADGNNVGSGWVPDLARAEDGLRAAYAVLGNQARAGPAS
ncbi:hypothetical protein AB0H36_06290 [Kribbella sp. NPDC050820]